MNIWSFDNVCLNWWTGMGDQEDGIEMDYESDMDETIWSGADEESLLHSTDDESSEDLEKGRMNENGENSGKHNIKY